MNNVALKTDIVTIPTQRVRPMRLILRNGYPYPYPPQTSEVEDETHSANAGGITLELPGVVHFEWLHTVTVEFENDDAFEHAQRITGWTTWSPRVLEAKTSAADGYQHPAIIAGDFAYCGFNLVAE
ncbi:hypothetical protein [Acidithiobacillus ferriphilus]|uniref:Uncharacterized protein n=1 Tax=Acidithiobacillus ferriphilus TaxID=1689834 RepID=A0ABU6FRN0_9PROT|nr:hypothetical protein [Acidithiobacillus ferriphilus]MEB8514713.1 hypothetical protein [Acidithiobacillus ferriphilus]